MTVDVSIIIVTWNAQDVVRDCLRSVLDESGDVSKEVIVVDNASADGTADMVAAEFPEITLIANQDNLGFAGGNNCGLEVATGRYVLLLNPDTLVLDDAVQKVVTYADANPKYGVVGCQVMESEDVVQRTCFSFQGPLALFAIASGLRKTFPRSRLFGWPDLGFWDRETERVVDVVSGMFMLVRREALDEVGPMDDSYFIYGEEADWCYRFGKAGWPCVFTPCARIVHVDGGNKSTDLVPLKMYVQLQKSLLIFNRKNLGLGAWLLTKLILITSMSVRGLVWGLLGLFGGGARAKGRARSARAALAFHLLGVEPAR